MGDDPFYDLRGPLVQGSPLPDIATTLNMNPPDTPQVAIFPTSDIGYPNAPDGSGLGWYSCAYTLVVEVKEEKKYTVRKKVNTGGGGDDPNAGDGKAGGREKRDKPQYTNEQRTKTVTKIKTTEPSPKSESFQMGGNVGAAVRLTVPGNAKRVTIYLTEVANNALDAQNADLLEQDSMEANKFPNVYKFTGPYKRGVLPPGFNETPLSADIPLELHHIEVRAIRREGRRPKNQGAFIQMGVVYQDPNGTTQMLAPTLWYQVKKNSGHYLEFRPNPNKIPIGSIGYFPYVRFAKNLQGEESSAWRQIRLNDNLDSFPVDQFVPVYPGDYPTGFAYSFIHGTEPIDDSTGELSPEEPPELYTDEPVTLNTSGLTPGLHQVRATLYFDDQESPPSEIQRITLSNTNQLPRIYQPFFVNRLENPLMIDTEISNPKAARGWVKGHPTKVVFDKKGVAHVIDKDNLTTRGDILRTPYGILKVGEFEDEHGGFVLIEMSEVTSGKAVVQLEEYEVTDWTTTPITVNPVPLRQTTLGTYRRNGQYILGFKMRKDGKKRRGAIGLDANTDIVRIRTIDDGSDPNAGPVNFELFQSNHGVFRRVTPQGRKFGDLPFKVPWYQPPEESFPHGGYCNVVESGEDTNQLGIYFDGKTGSRLDIPSHISVDSNALGYTNKTVEIRFRAGEDITTQQVLYKQGNATHGLQMMIQGGNLHYAMWRNGNTFTRETTPIFKHTKYLASLVYDATELGNKMFGYLDGELKVAGTGFDNLPQHTGNIAVGSNAGDTRDSADASFSGAAPFCGKIYEVRHWITTRTQDEVSINLDSDLDGNIVEGLGPHYRLSEMEGFDAYDRSFGNTAGLSGTFRWITDVPNAAYDSEGMGVKSYHGFSTTSTTLPSGWTSGATPTIGDDYAVSRFSDYGVRAQATGASGGQYFEYTYAGGLTEKSIGAAFRFATLPVGGALTILSIGSSCSLRLTADKTIVLNAGGTESTVIAGVEPMETVYLELKLEAVGTSSATARVFVGSSMDDELLEIGGRFNYDASALTHAVARVANTVHSGTISNTAELHVGDMVAATKGKNWKTYLAGNFIEYFGPPETLNSNVYGHSDGIIPVKAGSTVTLSIYAMNQDMPNLGKLMHLEATNSAGEFIEAYNYLINFADRDTEWTRYYMTIELPSDAANLEYVGNDVGEGLYRVQAIQLEDNAVVTPFTSLREPEGYLRVLLDSQYPGLSVGKPLDVLGKTTDVVEVNYEGLIVPNTSVVLEVSSAPDLDGPWSAYFTEDNIHDVPEQRYYEIKASLSTNDRQITPEVHRLQLEVERPYPMLCRGDGSEFKGGTNVINLGPVITRRLFEVTEMEDGGLGYTSWGRSEPPRWLDGIEFECYRESVAREISDMIGRGSSTFTIYARGIVMLVRVLSPVTWETNRMNKIILPDEDEDFYRFTGSIESAEVLAERDLRDKDAP
jgi:hypothetical protein